MSHLRLENRHTGEVLDIRRTRERGVECLELRGTLPPRRQGAILHVHHTQDEEEADIRFRRDLGLIFADKAPLKILRGKS